MKWIAALLGWTAWLVAGSAHGAEFDANAWIVEQQPGGTVQFQPDLLTIDDQGGCTVWRRAPVSAPVRIAYEARVRSTGRVSDLNCFWMATDPRHEDLLAPGHGRDGRFATYDALRTYYVGYGGNDNTTTRFRRYDGSGARPLLPEHDLRDAAHLLVPDHWYRIEITVAGGITTFARDGEVLFRFVDPAPLTRGWFGFRTVHSRIEVRNFSVSAPAATP